MIVAQSFSRQESPNLFMRLNAQSGKRNLTTKQPAKEGRKLVMNATSWKINWICKTLITSVALTAVVGMFTASTAFAGAIFTSDVSCNKINGNIYDTKQDVWLNGGPDGTGSALEPNTDYCIRVSAPGGNPYLNTKVCIVATDGSGHLACFNLFACTEFDDTDNPGGEYKVEACPLEDGQCVYRSDSQCKSDNFKVRASVCTTCGLMISCPLNFEVPCEGGNGAVVNYPAPIVTGGSGNEVVVCDPASGTLFSIGATTVTCAVTDGAASDRCSFVVTVTGTCKEECQPACTDVDGGCNTPGTCAKVVDYLQPLPCAGSTLTCTPASGTSFSVGTTPVHCTGTDSTGFPISCDFNVAVGDCEVPTITCPGPQTVCNDQGKCSAVVTFTVTATDNCPGVGSVSCTPASGSTFDVGTTPVNCSVLDASGNQASCNFTVTVNDCENPTIGACPPDKIVSPAANCCAIVTFTPPTASDNCGTVNVTCSPASGTCFNPGTTVVTCTATDGAGLKASCSFNVNVYACNGALTIGFWQNKNGQAIITRQAATGVWPAGTRRRQYAPFQDLSASATCSQVATYVVNVIKAANGSGSSMNPLLKAQMLATALDVYFSDPALGGDQIGAPEPIGGVSIDLTRICHTYADSLCTAYENAGSAFGGATCLTVSQLLSYAASQSNIGGSIWYGNVKATQELAKDTFDAI